MPVTPDNPDARRDQAHRSVRLPVAQASQSKFPVSAIQRVRVIMRRTYAGERALLVRARFGRIPRWSRSWIRRPLLIAATDHWVRPPWHAYAPIMTFDLVRSGSAALRRGLLRSGVAAGPLFVTVFLAEGARRPDYQPSRHPVSSLSLGPHGWVQAANFSAAGALCVAGAAGLSRSRDAIIGTRFVPALIGAAGLGPLGSAVFPTDPVGGYPPGTPDVPPVLSASMTRHG